VLRILRWPGGCAGGCEIGAVIGFVVYFVNPRVVLRYAPGKKTSAKKGVSLAQMLGPPSTCL